MANNPCLNGVRKFNNPHYDGGDSEISPNESPVGDNTEDQYLSDGTPSQFSTDKEFVKSNSRQIRRENAVEDTEDSDAYCKEVQCIELEELSRDQNRESTAVDVGTFSSGLSGNTEETGEEMMSTPVNANGEVSQMQNGFAYGRLEQRLHDVQRTIDSIASPYPDESSPHVPERFNLSRSWSCRANLMTGSYSPDKSNGTPLYGFENGFPGRPEGFGRKLPQLTFGSNTMRLPRNDSQSSLGSASMDELTSQSGKAGDEDITSVHTFVTGLQEMAKLEYEKKLVDGPVRNQYIGFPYY